MCLVRHLLFNNTCHIETELKRHLIEPHHSFWYTLILRCCTERLLTPTTPPWNGVTVLISFPIQRLNKQKIKTRPCNYCSAQKRSLLIISPFSLLPSSNSWCFPLSRSLDGWFGHCSLPSLYNMFKRPENVSLWMEFTPANLPPQWNKDGGFILSESKRRWWEGGYTQAQPGSLRRLRE